MTNFEAFTWYYEKQFSGMGDEKARAAAEVRRLIRDATDDEIKLFASCAPFYKTSYAKNTLHLKSLRAIYKFEDKIKKK